MKERLNWFLRKMTPLTWLVLLCGVVVIRAVLWFFWPSFGYPVTINGIYDGDTLCGTSSVEVLVPADGPNELGKDVRLSVDGKDIPYWGPDPQVQSSGPWDDGQLDIDYGIPTEQFSNGLHIVTVTYGWRNERYYVFFQNPHPNAR